MMFFEFVTTEANWESWIPSKLYRPQRDRLAAELRHWRRQGKQIVELGGHLYAILAKETPTAPWRNMAERTERIIGCTR